MLEGWVRATTTEQRLALRARIVLAAAAGTGTERIAVTEGVRPATVSKWRKRYAGQGLSGLQDSPRPGAVRRYDSGVERRVLEGLDHKPPAGHAKWTARLLARTLATCPGITYGGSCAVTAFTCSGARVGASAPTRSLLPKQRTWSDFI